VALVALIAGLRLVPRSERTPHTAGFDLAGAVTLTTGMVLLVYTLVQAPTAGWASLRTLGSLAAVAALLATFIWREQRAPAPLIRLGIFRRTTLVRANLGVMALAAWIGFQFLATLYMQQLRGWSALETGLAIFPAGALVATLSPRMGPLIGRFGPTRLAVAGLLSITLAYVLFLPVGLDASYAQLLPTFLLAGVGFGLAFGPLNVAATTGVAAEEQGLAGGLINTSMQLGAALVLAVVTAVVNATSATGSPEDLLAAFHTATLVPIAAALLGVVAMVQRRPAAVVAELPAEAALDEAA
jgi:hypothetical protein